MTGTTSVVDFLQAGIKAESLRQKAIANNVANLKTPGYRRIAVKFEQLLAEAMNSRGEADLDQVELELYHPNETAVKSNGNDVSLEVEVGQMVKNSLRHKTYIRLLNKVYRQIELAIDSK